MKEQISIGDLSEKKIVSIMADKETIVEIVNEIAVEDYVSFLILDEKGIYNRLRKSDLCDCKKL